MDKFDIMKYTITREKLSIVAKKVILQNVLWRKTETKVQTLKTIVPIQIQLIPCTSNSKHL
jgi:hypothetical protein